AVGLEARFRMKDGRVVEGLMSARVITIEGEPCILSISRDISERKAAEEKIRRSLREKEVLLREIHHRVKNNLGVIYSMLHFQKGTVGDGAIAEILENTQNRVKSMALVHQKLYGSDEVSLINFAEYCDELMGQLIKSVKRPGADIEIKLNVEEALLDIDTVLPCGLIINELVTNSLKYAFSDTGKGTISLDFNRGKEDRYLLRVSDDGRGMPETRTDRPAKTLGMFIVDSLTKQLGGTMEISSGPGVSVAVSFPVKENTPAPL
ncbi:MAG TPA: PAS domain S-box protein, partial [Spirochaetes bacterium]|nr:PAS domain S-box protein [Spirochaetota bacterium]